VTEVKRSCVFGLRRWIRGLMLADVPAIIGSLDIRFREID
jgi:NADH:ubiquinone oxidoreductase subunit D